MNRFILLLVIFCSMSAFPANADTNYSAKWKELFLRAWNNRLSPAGLLMADSLYNEGVRKNDIQQQCRAEAVRTVYYYYNSVGNKFTESITRLQQLSRKQPSLYPYWYFSALFAVDDYLRHRHSIKAMRTAHQMEQQAEKDKLKYGYHCMHLANAKIYAHNGEHTKALEYAENALRNASDANDLAKAYGCIIKCYHSMKQYDKAVTYTDKMYEISINDVQRMGALRMKCLALYYVGRYDDFNKCFSQLELISRQTGNNEFDGIKQVRIYNYLIRKQYEEASALAETMSDAFLSDKIEVMKARGNYDEALALFMKRLRYNDSLSYTDIHNDFAEIDYEVGNISLQQKLNAAQQHNMKIKSENLRFVVANSERELGLLRGKNELLKKNNYNRLLLLRKDSAEIEKLKVDEQLNIAKANNKKQSAIYKRNILIAVLGALLFIIILVTVYLHHKRRIGKSINAKNQELLKAKIMLEESQQRKALFMKSISHEIRTPANAIMGFTGLLSTPGIELSAEEKDDAKMRIKTNLRHLQTLIGDILDTKGLESEKIEVKMKQVNANDLCRSALSFIKGQCDAKGVKLCFSSDVADDFVITTDSRRLQQLLINYLTNAEKNTEEGNIRLTLNATGDNDWITFSVEDTGCGVPADKADSLFKRFEKVNQFKQGTGMGLYMCKIIANRLNGNVEFDRHYSPGARFLFKLRKAVILLLMAMSGMAVHAGNSTAKEDMEQFYVKTKQALKTEKCLAMADSLFIMADKQKDREMQCMALYVHVAYWLDQNNDRATFRRCRLLMEFAQKQGIKYYYYLAWYTRINRLFMAYRSIEALRELNAMRQQAKADNNAYGLARCYRAVGNIYQRNGDYSMAIKNFEDELHTIEHANTKQDLGDVYEKIGSCQKYLGLYKEAAKTFDKAIKTSNQPKVKSENMAWRGIVAFMLNDRATFIKYYEQLVNDPLAMQTMSSIIVRQTNMFYHINQGNWDKAFEICNVSNPTALDYMLLSDYYYFQGNIGKVLEMKEKRLACESLRRTDAQREDVALHLSQITKDQMDIQKHALDQELYALQLNNEQLQLNKTKLELEREKNNERIEQTIAENNRLALTEQNAILEKAKAKENLNQMNMQKAERQRRSLAIMIGIGILVLALLLYTAFRHRNSLVILRDKTRELEDQLAKIQESERLKEKFLAQMSHDINQPLNAVAGFTELLLRGTYDNDDEGKKSAKDIIEQSTQQILNKVSDAMEKALGDEK